MKIPRWIVVPTLVFWVMGVSLSLMIKMGSHYAALPGAYVGGQSPQNAGPWEAVHILSADCGCSGVVAHYLTERKPQTGLLETVWILDGHAEWERELSAAGFQVKHPDAGQVEAALGVQGVPWLLLRQSNQSPAYSGGYSAEPPRPGGRFQDLSLWRSLMLGTTRTKSLPAYGCATSRKLSAYFNPLGLRK